MANTTQAEVLKIAPELSVATADQWTLVLADVALLVTSTAISDSTMQELIQRYKVAHDLTILLDDDKHGAGITSQEMGDASRDYSTSKNGSEYDRTTYGVTFKKYWYRYRKVVIR